MLQTGINIAIVWNQLPNLQTCEIPLSSKDFFMLCSFSQRNIFSIRGLNEATIKFNLNNNPFCLSKQFNSTSDMTRFTDKSQKMTMLTYQSVKGIYYECPAQYISYDLHSNVITFTDYGKVYEIGMQWSGEQCTVFETWKVICRDGEREYPQYLLRKIPVFKAMTEHACIETAEKVVKYTQFAVTHFEMIVRFLSTGTIVINYDISILELIEISDMLDYLNISSSLQNYIIDLACTRLAPSFSDYLQHINKRAKFCERFALLMGGIISASDLAIIKECAKNVPEFVVELLYVLPLHKLVHQQVGKEIKIPKNEAILYPEYTESDYESDSSNSEIEDDDYRFLQVS